MKSISSSRSHLVARTTIWRKSVGKKKRVFSVNSSRPAAFESGAMLLLIFALTTLTGGAIANRLTFNDNNMPIRIVDWSTGQGNHRRIDHLEAVIRPHHLTTKKRVNFPTSGQLENYYQAIRAPGDERGHLVASQFSGPPQWYNLSPQNARVNRNKDYQSITTDWYGSECEVRKFLEAGGNREVSWTVDMTYVNNSNRPDRYHLRVKFRDNGQVSGAGIDTWIRNPFEREDSTFWVCRACRRTDHAAGCTRA